MQSKGGAEENTQTMHVPIQTKEMKRPAARCFFFF